MTRHVQISIRIAIAAAILPAIAGAILGFGAGDWFHPSAPSRTGWVDDQVFHFPDDPKPVGHYGTWHDTANAVTYSVTAGLVTFALALLTCLLLRVAWIFLLDRLAELSSAIRENKNARRD